MGTGEGGFVQDDEAVPGFFAGVFIQEELGQGLGPLESFAPENAAGSFGRGREDDPRDIDSFQEGAGHGGFPCSRCTPDEDERVAGVPGVADGGLLDVSTDAGTVTLPVAVTPMGDHIVWLPTCSPGSEVRDTLRAGSGTLVRLAVGSTDLTVGTDSEVQS